MTTDIDMLEANIKNLERENRELRMTLRDQIAMAVLPTTMGYESGRPAIRFAEIAYRWADVMLEARR